MFAIKPTTIHRNTNLRCQLRSPHHSPMRKPQNKRAFNIGGDAIIEYNIRTLQEVIVNNSYILGKYIGYVVLFTAVLNWMTYRRMRKFMDEDDITKK